MTAPGRHWYCPGAAPDAIAETRHKAERAFDRDGERQVIHLHALVDHCPGLGCYEWPAP